ncbi:MAG TPA: hypothetical protein VNA04_01440 [Thermoanaerobaculia bacterium]|nr:hypothetical protein [Thermoanaerobaculia bacterium]
MTVKPKQIEFLARAIVNRLEDRGLVEFQDAEAGIEIVTQTLEENFRSIEAEEVQQSDRE